MGGDGTGCELDRDETDGEIPGPGMHTAVWDSERRCYLYPFDHEFEGILRGLRYIPA